MAAFSTIAGVGLAAAGAASALGGGGGSSSQAIDEFNPLGIRTSGLTASPKGVVFDVKSSPERQRLVKSLASLFPEQANLTRGLRDMVRPGMGALTEARLTAIDNSRSRAIGNLRENLARRRVLGSSFAQDALSRTEAEFGEQEAKARAQSFLEELEITNQLITQEFDQRRNEFQTFLDEMNLQADVATQLASGATSQLGANARLKAQLAAEEAAGRGSFFGQLIEPIASAGSKTLVDRLFGSAANPVLSGAP